MSDFSFFGGADGTRIKQEPIEDDGRMDYQSDLNTSSRDADQGEDLFVTSEDEDSDDGNTPRTLRPASSGEDVAVPPPQRNVLPRASKPDGMPFPSVCNEYPHTRHPHHRRLICGHDIVTDTIEPCGKNCRPSSDAAEKIDGLPFECPHPRCVVSQTEVFIAKKDRRGRKITPKLRPATLSHVYGKDKKADRARAEEKATKMLEDFDYQTGIHSERLYFNKKQVGFERKHTQSPEPGPTYAPSPRKSRQQRRKQEAPEFDADLLQKIVDEQRRQRREGDQVRMRAAAAAEAAANAQKPTTANVPQALGDFFCNICRSSCRGSGFKCFACDDQHDDFDICLACYDGHIHEHDPTHLVRLIMRHDVEELPRRFTSAAVETVCDCEDLSTRYMVMCANCDQVAFHPGCCGAGKYLRSSYLIEDDDKRATYRVVDWRLWKKEHRRYLCNTCIRAKDKIDSLAPNTFAEGTVSREERMKVRETGRLSREITKLGAWFDGREKEHARDFKAANSVDEQIEVQEKWIKILEARKFDVEVYYEEDPIESPEREEPGWKQGKKRTTHDAFEEDLEDSDVDDPDVREISKSDVHDNKRQRKLAVPRGMRTHVPDDDEMHVDAEPAESAEGRNTTPASPEDQLMDDMGGELHESVSGEQDSQSTSREPTGLEHMRVNASLPGLFPMTTALTLRQAPSQKRWGVGKE